MRSFIILNFLSLAAAVLLPGPNGPYSVSMSALKLTDTSRVDPYAPTDHPHLRNLMVSLFTPINSTTTPCEKRSSPYMTSAVAADYDLLATSIGLPNGTFTSFEIETCQVTPRCRCGCGGSSKPSAFPLVLFSPGSGQSRLLYGLMARSLASQGYVVVTIDHPYDASVVEFPDGTVVRDANISSDDIAAIEQVTLVRTADTSFVLDQLKGSSTFSTIIRSRGAKIDFDRVVMAGHSLGGATAATVMLSDSRILGGVDMDGRFFNPVLEKGLDKPFLLLGRPNHSAEDETWPALWPKLRGPRVEMAVAGAVHGSFTDFPALLDSLNLPEALRSEADGFVGSISGERMDKVVVGVLTAFCDFVFGRSVPEILKEGSDEIPEVGVVAADL